MALRVYRKILRSARNFPWKSEGDRVAVLGEARQLFQENRGLSDPAAIKNKLFEAETRLELALHYKIPFPRLYVATVGI